MYILLAVFYVSLLGIAVILLNKRREIRTGRPTLINLIGHKTDDFFHSIFGTVGRWISYFNRQTFIVAIQLVAFHVLLHIRKLYVEIKHRALVNPHSRKVIDAVRGRGEVKRHGASFYLRRISVPDRK